jgi:hypothetical protein
MELWPTVSAPSGAGYNRHMRTPSEDNVERTSQWQLRQEFLQVAQRTVPEIGLYLQEHGMGCGTSGDRRKVIGKWQQRFNLPDAWAGQCAWITLAMWDRSADFRNSLTWFAAPPIRNLAETELPRFKFPAIERDFHVDLDFAWFKQSVHGALEAALKEFGDRIGAENLESYRQPKHLTRAFKCVALRRCRGLSPKEIVKLQGYAQDWTTLLRDMQSAAKLMGLSRARRGRPPRKTAI